MEREWVLPRGGVDLQLVQRGEQPRAVFLHGFAGDLFTWDALWRELGPDLPALRYDLRGFGRSVDAHERPFRHADDLLLILDTVGLATADLVGVSMGGAVALNFALEHPQRVRRLVLISPAIMAWEWSEDWRQLWRPIADRARAGAMDAARELWWLHPLFDTVRDSAAGPALRKSIDRFGGCQWLADAQLPSLPDVERLYSLQPPTLLLSGGRDLADFRLMADLLENTVTGLQRVDFPDCGHMLHLEAPAEVARHLRRFLGAPVQR